MMRIIIEMGIINLKSIQQAFPVLRNTYEKKLYIFILFTKYLLLK